MKKDLYKVMLWIVVGLLMLSITTLPDIIPVRYDIHGDVEYYGSRYYLVFIYLLPLITYYGMEYTKKIDPKRESIIKKEEVYDFYSKVISMFYIVIGIYLTYLSKDGNSDIRFICLLLGLLLIAFGNYMPKLPQNYYLGIKTLWTIKDEYVWKKTHRLGGFIFIMCGLFYWVCAIVNEKNMLVYSTIVLIISCIYLFMYSYKIYKMK